MSVREPTSPFHRGEIAVQQRAGVHEKAVRLGQRFIRDAMPDEHRAFFAGLRWVVLASIDENGHPAATFLGGEPGFLASPDPKTLVVQARPHRDDPVAAGIRRGAPVAFLGIQLFDRRRNRMNGRVAGSDSSGFVVEVEQSFGNCPAWIQARGETAVDPGNSAGPPRTLESLSQLRAAIEPRDMFFLATLHPGDEEHPEPSVDVSHRGGRPGFVKVEEGPTLTFPDFAGNSFFNTLGNLAADPRTTLLFPEPESGDVVHVEGDATVVWDGPELESFSGAGRLVKVAVRRARRFRGRLPVTLGEPCPWPALDRTGSWSD